MLPASDDIYRTWQAQAATTGGPTGHIISNLHHSVNKQTEASLVGCWCSLRAPPLDSCRVQFLGRALPGLPVNVSYRMCYAFRCFDRPRPANSHWYAHRGLRFVTVLESVVLEAYERVSGDYWASRGSKAPSFDVFPFGLGQVKIPGRL